MLNIILLALLLLVTAALAYTLKKKLHGKALELKVGPVEATVVPQGADFPCTKHDKLFEDITIMLEQAMTNNAKLLENVHKQIEEKEKKEAAQEVLALRQRYLGMQIMATQCMKTLGDIRKQITAVNDLPADNTENK